MQIKINDSKLSQWNMLETNLVQQQMNVTSQENHADDQQNDHDQHMKIEFHLCFSNYSQLILKSHKI